MSMALDIRYAVDPVAWCSDVIGFNPDPWQEEVLLSRSRRMILNCSRQSGKSTTAAAVALHMALYSPGSLTILISPTDRQSGELFRKVSDHLKAMQQQPETDEDNKRSLTLKSGSRIISLPGSEGTIRGYSAADLIVFDEGSKAPDDLYYAVLPMLAVSNGRLIVMSTPFGKRGWFSDIWHEGGPDWEKIRITACDCPRISPEFLHEQQNSMPIAWYRQEYECSFEDSINSVFPSELISLACDDSIQPLLPQRAIKARWGDDESEVKPWVMEEA